MQMYTYKHIQTYINTSTNIQVQIYKCTKTHMHTYTNPYLRMDTDRCINKHILTYPALPSFLTISNPSKPAGEFGDQECACVRVRFE